MFALVGAQIVRAFDQFDDGERKRFFDLIEQFMSSTDSVLADATATGLLEGIVAACDRAPGTLERIRPYLRPLSLSYIEGGLPSHQGRRKRLFAIVKSLCHLGEHHVFEVGL